MNYIETSAKDLSMTNQVFTLLVREIMKGLKDKNKAEQPQ
jgi:hypothetical protein